MINVPASFDLHYCATICRRPHKKVVMSGALPQYVHNTFCGQIKNLSGGLEIASSEFSLIICHSVHGNNQHATPCIT